VGNLVACATEGDLSLVVVLVVRHHFTSLMKTLVTAPLIQLTIVEWTIPLSKHSDKKSRRQITILTPTHVVSEPL
jgi:hypothetical protein